MALARYLLLLAGLATSLPGFAQDNPPFRLGPVTVVASEGPGFRVFPGVSVAWAEDAIQVVDDNGLVDEALEEAFRDAIRAGLKARGYRFAEADQATYELGFLLSLSDSLGNEELLSRYQLTPGLSDASGERFKRGTLALVLLNPTNGEVMWRGAIQAFADLEADPALRRQRISLATQRLLRALPQAPTG